MNSISFLRGWRGICLLACILCSSLTLLQIVNSHMAQSKNDMILWLCVWTMMRRRWSFVLSFSAIMLFILAITEHLVSGWFPHWLSDVSTYPHDNGPFPLQVGFGFWPGLLLTLSLLIWTLYLVWQRRYCEPGSVDFGVSIAAILALTFDFTVYIPSLLYNQMLLFPAFLILCCFTAKSYYSRLAKSFAVLSAFLMFLLVLIAIAGGALTNSEVWVSVAFLNYLLPAAILLALLLMFAPVSMNRFSKNVQEPVF